MVYTWTIPWLDDYGAYTADPEDIKTEVFPKNKSITERAIAKALQEGSEAGLITLYKVDGSVCQQYNNFDDFQTFKADRERKHEFPAYKEGLETTGIQRNPMSPNVPLSKVKLSKVKLSKDKYKDYVFLSGEEYTKLVEKFGEAGTDDRIETLNNYLGSSGRKYKSHYHTILAWERKDMPKKPNTSTAEYRKRVAERSKNFH